MSDIDKLAADAKQSYLERSAQTFCEAAIHLMMTCMSVKRVIAFLRRQIEILEEYE